MTIRHKLSGDFSLIPDPGAAICENCPLHPDTCKSALHVAHAVRRQGREPDCLIDYLYWRLRSTSQAKALRIGDEAARETIAKSGKLLRYWYRRVEVYADRAAFVAGLAK